MYIFRIIDMIDRSKAWYKGEEFAAAAYEDTVVVNPPSYPPSSSSGDAGDPVDRYGYVYTSLLDDNSDTPEYNYVGYPLSGEYSGKNSWIRSGYSNKTKMIAPESGGITESYGAGMSGSLKYPTGSTPNGMHNYVESCTCCLFCGVLGGSITVNDSTINGINVNAGENGYSNPEITGLNSAFTMSNYSYAPLNWTIAKADNTPSTYCAGAYLGSWSYIGKTQWTDHKKNTNDYSTVQQDDWGNYSLSKGRVGRTYSAEVLLSVRKDAASTDYDVNIIDLCFSVSQILRSLLGKPAAFYFNNQDIGCMWVPHNTNKAGELVQLVDSDIIVGILQNFEIVNIQGETAKVNMSVSSVPNEYQNYSLVGEDVPQDPEDAPVVTGATPLSLLGILIASGSTIEVPDAITSVNIFTITPSTAAFSVTSVTASNSLKCTAQGVWYNVDASTMGYQIQISKVATSFSDVTLTVQYRYVDSNLKMQYGTLSYSLEA